MISIRPHLRHCATCRATVRDMRFSRTRRLALLLPFGWLARLASRSEVALYSASTGGGRFGPAAAVLGICLSGGVAGAACVMTGALPAPPIIAHVSSDAKRPEPPKRVAAKKRTPARVAKATPTRRRDAARDRDRHGDAAARARPCARRSRSRRPRSGGRPRRASRDEFTFEGTGGSGATTTSSPKASAANVGDGSSGGGGGSRKPASAPKGPSGGEFGFEGG